MGMYLYGTALRDFFRARRILPWAFLSLVGLAIAMAWKNLAPSASIQEVYGQVSFIIVFKLLALASAIFSTAIIGQEVEQKTIVYLLTRPVQRWKLLLARYFASATVVASIGILCAAMVALGTFGPSGLTKAIFLRDCYALILGALAYGGLFLLISLWFNRAMIICLLFAFGWETSLPNLPGDASMLSIFSYLSAVAEHPTQGDQNFLSLLAGQLGSGTLTATVAVPVLIIVSIFTVGMSCWWFSTFEYVPREDAE